MTDLTELVDWLRSQIESDQAHADKDLWAAARATKGNWRALYGVNLPSSSITADDEPIITLTAERHEADVLLVARFKPETVARRARDTIARCEAELAIIDEHPRTRAGSKPGNECKTCSGDHWGEPYPCPTLRKLAHGYRHRPGWKEEWKP